MLGTVLLMAVTATLIAGVALGLQQAATRAEAPDAPQVQLAVSADATSVTLAHVGQGPLDAREVLVSMETASGRRLLVEGTRLIDLAPALPVFSIGTYVTVPFDACATTAWCVEPPAPGEPVSVTLRSLAHGRAAVGEASFVAQAPAASSTLAIAATTPADGATLRRGEVVRLSVTLDAASPSAARAVDVDLSALGGSSSLALRDDGTGGDRVAGDLVYEAYQVVPAAGEAADVPLVFSVVTDERILRATATVHLLAALAPADWLEVTIDDDAPWPDKAAPFSPVFVNGTNFHLVGSVAYRGADGALLPAIWMIMETRPPNLQLQLLAPANPTDEEQAYEIVLFTPFGAPVAPGPLVVVPAAQAAEFPPASLPPPVPHDPNAPIELYPPVISKVTGFDASGAATPGTATTSFARVLVEGRDLEHLTRVVLESGDATIAVTWAPLHAGALQLVTHPGIPPGSYDVVVSNPAYTSRGGPLVVPAPAAPTILAVANALPPGGASGSPRDEVLITGTDLELVHRVRLVGPVEARDATWWRNGTALRAIVPAGTAPGSYALEVVAASGSDSASFLVEAAQPTISRVTPDRAREYAQVQVVGTRFLSVTSVTVQNATVGTLAVPWSVTNDTHLSLFTHPGLPVGDHEVVVAAGALSARAPLAIEPGILRAPSDVALSPTSAHGETLVTLTGRELASVSRITLHQTNVSRTIVAEWYLEAEAIRLTVPAAAVPPGNWSQTYRVELTGAFTGRVVVPTELTVLPAPPPTIASFSPSTGAPFTQIDVVGGNFVNVRAVLLGEVPLYFALRNSTQILAVTHTGIAPGNHTLTVATATGSATTTLRFAATPMRLVPTYNATLIASIGVNITTVRTSQNDPVDPLHVKIRPQAGWNVTAVTFNPVNYLIQQSGATEASLTRDASCNNGVSRWVLSSTPLAKYNALANQLNYVLGVTLTNGVTTTTTYVFTNDPSRNFILPAGQLTDTIRDAGFPATGFLGCGA